ncbi:MAG: ribonuclease P protein component [Spirochaetaceae bacterium]|jgi:ribonuclease P protein component|nr:ribonuclease P protein component [Spirochaetaceae bacterium]
MKSGGKSFGFPKEEHLKSSSDISMVFKRGKSVSCAGARLFFIQRNKRQDEVGETVPYEYNRIAFVFSRKFGNAVQRNRARRLGREAYRYLRVVLKQGLDMALLVYPDEKACLKSRLAQLEILFRKADMVDRNEKDN